MPELPEIEAYRSLAEATALHRAIATVDAPDSWYLKGGLTGDELAAVLVGRAFGGARRRGKLLLLDLEPAFPRRHGAGADRSAVLGVRFGMSGRLVVDTVPGVDALLYTTAVDRLAYVRFGVGFADGGHLAVRDPRRLGGILLDPDEAALGPDARHLTIRQLRAALAGGTGPLKARLMDQARIAGIGNLLADEILWRASLSPWRPAGGLAEPELRRLRAQTVGTVEAAIREGGSHTGKLMAARRPGGRCPRDGATLRRDRLGGRSTWWCPRHQR